MRHVLYAFETGAGLIDELTTFGVNPNFTTSLVTAGGDIEPNMISLGQTDPEVSLGTLAIAKALGILGISGIAIPGGVNPATFFFQQMAQDGARAAGLAHLKGTIEAGMIVPRELSVRQNGNAVLTVDVLIRYDKTNAPIVWANNVALVGSPAFTELFTLGPVVINGTELPAVQGVRINFGLNVFKDWEGGDTRPTFLSLKDRQNVSITVETRNAPALSTFGLEGTAQGVTDSIVYLRKKSNDGTGNVADATAQHIAISMAAGHIGPGETRATHPEPGEVPIVLTPRSNGVDPILALSTASTIVVP